MGLNIKGAGINTRDYLSELSNEKDSTIESVDRKLLDLVKSLDSNDNVQDFHNAVAETLQKIGFDLRLARHLLGRQDKSGLDQIAQTISQNALKIGASRVLSVAIEIQGLARIGAFSMIETLMVSLENDLIEVKSKLGQ